MVRDKDFQFMVKKITVFVLYTIYLMQESIKMTHVYSKKKKKIGEDGKSDCTLDYFTLASLSMVKCQPREGV